MSIPREIVQMSMFLHLENYKEIELIILKGHLLLEIFLSNVISDKELSFYAKIKKYENIYKSKKICMYLLRINKIRNELAHEWNCDIDTQIVQWADDVLNNIEYSPPTKRTYRLKIIHAFSALAGEIYYQK